MFRTLHSTIRRNLLKLERMTAVLAMTALLYILIESLPVYPPYWDIVILGAVFLVGLFYPAIGYFLAVAGAAYPLLTVNLYLMVLFLVVALLGHRTFIENLGGIALVLAAPLLSGYGLAWGIPLLGGLWWGWIGGAWVGFLASLWGMLVAGMAGLNPDWLVSIGTIPSMDAVITRFSQANSLETLLLLLEPLAPDTTTLLYHLLQIALWAIVGGLIGDLAERKRLQTIRPWGSAFLAIVFGFVLVGGLAGLSFWLGRGSLEILASRWRVLALSALTVGVVVAALEGLHDFFEHPYPSRPVRRRKRKAGIASEPATPPEPVPLPSQFPDWDRNSEGDDEDDLIMLELD